MQNPIVLVEAIIIDPKTLRKARLTIDDSGQDACGDDYTHMLYVDLWSEEKQDWVEGDDLPYESYDEALTVFLDCIKWAGYVCATGEVYEGQLDGTDVSNVTDYTPEDVLKAILGDDFNKVVLGEGIPA